MKKILQIILLISSYSYASCNNILTVYYTWSGNTQFVANEIHDIVGGDIVKVEVSVPYSARTDQELYPIATQELAAISENGIYPAINTVINNIDDYDTFFICYPLWHARMATPMQALLYNCGQQLTGKTVALFCTSASTDIAGTIADANRLCPKANFTKPLWIKSANIVNSHDKVVEWLHSINLYPNNQTDESKLNIIIGDNMFSATLYDNEAAALFKTLLPMTVDMTELNGNEKFCWLTTEFPGTASNPGTIHAGDLMIWSSRCLVLYYETFVTSYSFIKLGYIDDASAFASAVGSGNVTVTYKLVSTTGIVENKVPGTFALEQNYPNPFNPVTTIKYSIPDVGTGNFLPVRLKIYNFLGQEVATLVNERKLTGNYEIRFDGSHLSPGIYFYKIQAGNYSDTKKLTLLK